jgi:hypothetical protein
MTAQDLIKELPMLLLIQVLVMQNEPQFKGIVGIGAVISHVSGLPDGSIEILTLRMDYRVSIIIEYTPYFIIGPFTAVSLGSVH